MALYFQTFIESNTMINGQPVQVLYGGVQWGYEFSTTETPIPAALPLFATGALALLGWRRKRKSTAAIGAGRRNAMRSATT